MKRWNFAYCALLAATSLGTQLAFAHGAAFDCYLEREGQVKCEAGFTDGSSAVGRKILVRDLNEKVLLEGQVGPDSSYGFQVPQEAYSVTFLGGEGHEITLQSTDITQ
ncbi:hypothetical protein QP835_10645 [Pseudomonas oryzihabitans]|uniref:hypothetical protein n=1 Tax=Pseudomonas oryzihabitans TaxID=47885 RepID=UPI002556FD0B|nr:hypothetical protein [Pseudomonas oryzihabitans]MDK8264732.1 hypothetical protein [Pseudomonas oryzihabitans]